jgi:modification methylase
MPDRSGKQRLPVTSVWLTGQLPARGQRVNRYIPETIQHPARMLPAIAAHAISAYTTPGQLVLDPMCGAGTSLVEAVRAGRPTIGVDIEPHFTSITAANLDLARRHGATEPSQVITGDATRLASLLPAGVAGQVSLVLTSPPYGRTTHGVVRSRPGRGVDKRHHLYHHNGDPVSANLARTDLPQLVAGFTKIMVGSYQVLKPGGILVFTSRPIRRTHDDLVDLPGEFLAAAMECGFQPLERCVAMLAAFRDGQIIHRASMFAMMAVRRARQEGIPASLIAHEDVLVLRKPR